MFSQSVMAHRVTGLDILTVVPAAYDCSASLPMTIFPVVAVPDLVIACGDTKHPNMNPMASAVL